MLGRNIFFVEHVWPIFFCCFFSLKGVIFAENNFRRHKFDHISCGFVFAEGHSRGLIFAVARGFFFFFFWQNYRTCSRWINLIYNKMYELIQNRIILFITETGLNKLCKKFHVKLFSRIEKKPQNRWKLIYSKINPTKINQSQNWSPSGNYHDKDFCCLHITSEL